MARTLVVVTLVLGCAALAPAQTSTSAPHSGGFSPFRGRDFAAVGFDAVSLEQPDAPIEIALANATRDDRGVVLTLRLTNSGAAAVSRTGLAVWAFGADGTLRGRQQQRVSQAVPPGESRSADLVLRTLAVNPGDRVVVAVQEVSGEAPWKKELKALEGDVRKALGQ